jgi:hypothetical protein
VSAAREAPPIDLLRRPSRELAAWTFLIHAAALGALAAVRLPDWAVAGLAAAVLVSAITISRQHVTLRAARAVTRLVWTRDGEWLLSDAGGRALPADLQPGAFVTLRLVVLNFRLGDGRRSTVLLTRDNCDAVQLRRLRARLRSERE